MMFKDGDILITRINFEDGRGSKVRPVVYISEDADHLHVLKMTSKFDNKSWYFKQRYVALKNNTSLDKQSYVDVHKIIKTSSKFARKIGHLSNDDYKRVVYRMMTKNEVIA